jgi:molybdenum cofactor cytidylyltransferase
MVRAVILAAGASSRMGTPKAMLPLTHAADTFLARLVKRFCEAGIPDIVIVTGAHAGTVRGAAGRIRLPVRFEHNDHWRDGQLTSLLAGLRDRAGDEIEAALVTLVDAPFVSADTIRRVVRVWRTEHALIVRPSHGDLHGHPVLFDRSLFHELHAADPKVGAKAVVRSHAAHIVNVPVDDPGAFVDIDTPEDYQAALRHVTEAARG